MMASNNMPVVRACMLVAGTVVGGYCGLSAFRNGLMSAPGLDGYLLGSAGAAVAFGSWFLMPYAAHLKQEGERAAAWVVRLGWLLCTVFVLWNAVGYTATHRTEKVEGADLKIEAYKRADRQLKGAEAELEALKQNKRWEATAGCSNATAAKSKEFCGQVAVTKSNISTAQYTLNQGRPGSADAQAEAIGFAIQLPAVLVGKLTPLLWALALELAQTFFFYCAFRPSGRKEAAPEVVVTEAPASQPVDLSPLLALISDAQAQISAARTEYDRAAELVPFYHYQAMLIEAADLFVDEPEDVIGYTAPAVTEPVVIAPVATPIPLPVAKAKKAEPVVATKRKMRDSHGRFAKKAKLVAVTEKPQVKPQLSAVPLGGQQNVVIFGSGPKKD